MKCQKRLRYLAEIWQQSDVILILVRLSTVVTKYAVATYLINLLYNIVHIEHFKEG